MRNLLFKYDNVPNLNRTEEHTAISRMSENDIEQQEKYGIFKTCMIRIIYYYDTVQFNLLFTWFRQFFIFNL